MNSDEARACFAAALVARLATVSVDHRPHLVPITFALLDGDTLVTAVDHKPKRTVKLQRLANISAHPSVAVLVDHYSDDWDELWWARADGRALLVEPPADPRLHARSVAALAERYPQYREHPPSDTVIVVEVERWSGWTASSVVA